MRLKEICPIQIRFQLAHRLPVLAPLRAYRGVEVGPWHAGVRLEGRLPAKSCPCDTKSLGEVVPTSTEGTTRVTG